MPAMTTGTSRSGMRWWRAGTFTTCPCTPRALARASSGLPGGAPPPPALPPLPPVVWMRGPRPACCEADDCEGCDDVEAPRRFAIALGSLSATTSPSMISTIAASLVCGAPRPIVGKEGGGHKQKRNTSVKKTRTKEDPSSPTGGVTPTRREGAFSSFSSLSCELTRDVTLPRDYHPCSTLRLLFPLRAAACWSRRRCSRTSRRPSRVCPPSSLRYAPEPDATSPSPRRAPRRNVRAFVLATRCTASAPAVRAHDVPRAPANADARMCFRRRRLTRRPSKSCAMRRVLA